MSALPTFKVVRGSTIVAGGFPTEIAAHFWIKRAKLRASDLTVVPE